MDGEFLLMARIAELEAELVEKDKTLKNVTWRAANTITALSGEVKDYLMRVEREKARAEKAEARWDSCKRMLEDRNAQLDKAEAEVERLRHLGGAPPGVSPSPQCPDCERDPPAYAGVHARWHDSERVCPVCSSQMICPTPSRHYGVIPRKERDDGCGATTHTVVHADGNVCPFLVPRSP